MQPLYIKPTSTSLEVSLDAGTGVLSFKGRSVSEHSVEFFKPVIDWMEQYSLSPSLKTEAVFHFEYFNSAARKSLVEIFRVLQSIHKKGFEVSVRWVSDSEDEGMRELGEEYESMTGLSFSFSVA